MVLCSMHDQADGDVGVPRVSRGLPQINNVEAAGLGGLDKSGVADLTFGNPGNSASPKNLKTAMASRSSRSTPRIVHVCNFWTMAGQQTAGKDWRLDRKIKLAREAGFGAVSTIPGSEHAELAEKLGLRLPGSFASTDPARFPEMLGRMREAGVRHVNVQLGRHDTPTRAAVAMTSS